MAKRDTRRDMQIKSVDQYVHEVFSLRMSEARRQNNVDLLFRGQNADYNLIPKLGRKKIRGQSFKELETLIFQEFRRTSSAFKDFEPDDDWGPLAMAQHHGLPTRLLDWTQSGLAALWFSIRKPLISYSQGAKQIGDATVNKQRFGAVWILCPELDDYLPNPPQESPFANSGRTRIYRPRMTSPRIVSQAGAFTVHKILKDGEVFGRLEENPAYSNKLVKFTFDARLFPQFRKDLNLLGVNAAAMFPDLDGLCEHLEGRYIWADDEL